MKRIDRDGWPALTVQVQLAPWHWRYMPFFWMDWDCTSSCSIEWLFLKVDWFANRPLFRDTHTPGAWKP